ncbi:MAG: hypothetical protein E7418_00375 [Ruminococcaceae bacterium]|nr:hypothetical protein [Oscillospiraceae bacterium]
MQSSIFHFFARIFHSLADWFGASLFGRGFNRVATFCAKVFAGSLLGRFFDTHGEGHVFSESIFGQLLALPVKLIRRLGEALHSITPMTETSSIYWLLSAWHTISIRAYGLILLFFSLFYGIFRTLWAEPTTTERICVGLMIVVALLAIIVNRSLKSLFKGSTLLTSFGGLFCTIRKDVDSKLFLKDPEISLSRPVIALLIGLLSALAASFMSPVMAILLFGGIIFLAFALKSTTFCVFTVLITAPVLPTMVLVGLSLLTVASFLLRLLANPKMPLRKVPLAGYIAVFALTLALGAVNSFTFIKSMQILLIYYAFMLFYFVAFQTLDTPKKWRAAVVSFVMVAALVALYGIYQNFAGVSSTQSWVDSDMFKNIKVRVYSTFDNPNVLGEFLVLLIPVAFAFVWKSRTDGQKLTYSGLLAMLGVCLIFTWSRGAWLGMALALILYCVIMDKHFWLLGLVGLCMLPMFLGSDSAIVNRLLSIGNTADTSTAYRVSIWRASINMIHDFWLSGIGLGSDAFASIYPKYALAGANYALHAHNLFLQLWAETGIAGITSFLILVLMFVKQNFSGTIYRSRNGLDNALSMAMTAGVLGFLFQGLTDNVWYNYKMVLIFWIMLALAGSVSASDYNGGDGK